ncbi:hypothetical protein HY991_00715 [Candidatus Micrarchaeota archaeon]|nr:hypothetical protein [Candidatus Micrarchaeota archaeon]
MNKTVRVILSPDAEEVYKYLNEKAPSSKLERSILNAVNKKVELIKANIHYGEPISKDKIPLEFKQKYGVTNLFRVELPQFWRMLYTLTDGESEIEIIAFILEISSHEDYDKLFGYKKK